MSKTYTLSFDFADENINIFQTLNDFLQSHGITASWLLPDDHDADAAMVTPPDSPVMLELEDPSAAT